MGFLQLPSDANVVGPRGDAARPPPDDDGFRCGGNQEAPDSLAPEGLSLWVDPLQRALAEPRITASESAAPAASHPALALEALLRGVRRIAWGGDRQRSVAYIELGAGELNGAALTLEARGNAISLVMHLPPGASAAGWARRLTERLAERGLEVESVEVR